MLPPAAGLSTAPCSSFQAPAGTFWKPGSCGTVPQAQAPADIT